jgi:uncharacterized membrane protein
MTKQEFMRRLDDALARLKPEERKDILADFEEHFTGGISTGKTEEEVARELGDPVALAAQYTEGLPEPKTPIKASGVAAGALASIALLLFDAMIALPIIAAFFAVWISLWAVALSLFASALACMVAPFVFMAYVPNALVGVGSFMLALSVLAGIGMFYVSKWSYRGLAGYVKAHVRIIRGGTNA